MHSHFFLFQTTFFIYFNELSLSIELCSLEIYHLNVTQSIFSYEKTINRIENL